MESQCPNCKSHVHVPVFGRSTCQYCAANLRLMIPVLFFWPVYIMVSVVLSLVLLPFSWFWLVGEAILFLMIYAVLACFFSEVVCIQTH